MKRAIAAALALIMLLFGCSKETGGTQPAAHDIPIRAIEASADFGKFTAEPPGEGEASARALISAALARYPASLLDQLGAVELLLVSDLTGEDDFSHGSYAGFTQHTDQGWQIVLDVTACDAGTVHHELAHILDAILTEAGALTESDWLALCPSAFTWGDTNWADYPDFFCDAYAMSNIQEDRARTFEEAMQLGPGAFENQPALWLKLEYFSHAIRTHFDTTGWPDQTDWEEALADSNA